MFLCIASLTRPWSTMTCFTEGAWSFYETMLLFLNQTKMETLDKACSKHVLGKSCVHEKLEAEM